MYSIIPGAEYQLIENLTLYYHKSSGYLYDPATQQFFIPTSSYTATEHEHDGTQVAATVSSGPTGDIASVLAAASDRVVAKCGYVFDDSTGMYYDAGLGLYYHQDSHLPYSHTRILPSSILPSSIPQDSQLYYDAESGT